MTHQPHEYIAIAAWGRMLGSFNYYIEQEQHRAASEGAPRTSIYRNDDGSWSTINEIHNRETLVRLANQMVYGA